MSKITSHEPFGRLQPKLWAKERPGVKTPSLRENDSRPLKVGNRPDLLGCRQRATYRWKALNEGYNFALDRITIKSYAPSKSRESWLAGFRDSHAGVPGEKSHLDASSVESHRVYYKGEGGGFPQVRAVVSLVCPCCPWLVLAPKVLQLCTNHFVWVVCRPM
jgi:hypothetical protein